ncbi:MAG: DUF1203 domain-containing protein [Beijerinckiaceae bacterium]
MTYRVTGLNPDQFAPLFAMNDTELAAQGAVRCMADRNGAYPCRVSMVRVAKGEELILLNFAHHVAPGSPYRASGPIFVARQAKTAAHYEGELPPMMRDTLISLRAYDAKGMMLEGDIAEGPYADIAIRKLLKIPEVQTVHGHFARRGCFAAAFVRA